MPYKEVIDKYRDEMQPLYEAYAMRLRILCTELIHNCNIPIVQVEARAKSVKSFCGKIDKKNYADPLSQITDLAGVRIVTYYNDDVTNVCNVLRKEFKIDEKNSSDKFVDLEVDEFGYRSVHLVVSLTGSRKDLIEWRPYQTLYAEVQVRSVLQHSWAAISHKLDYKTTSQAPMQLRRKLFRLSALLEMADDEFANIRDTSQALTVEYKSEVDKGQLDIPINLDSVKQYIVDRNDINNLKSIGIDLGMSPEAIDPSEVEDFTRLLNVLKRARIQTIADFDSVLSTIIPKASSLLSLFLQKLNELKIGTPFFAVLYDIIAVLLLIELAPKLPQSVAWADFREDIKNAILKTRREVHGPLTKSKVRSANRVA